MAELQRRFVWRWPLAVLAAAGVAAASLGDLVTGWFSIAGRGSSAPGEYPIRIALQEPGPAIGERLALPPRQATGVQGVETNGVPVSEMAERLADILPRQPQDTLQPDTTGVAQPSTDGFLAIQFDLGDPDKSTGGGSAIEVRKAVRLNGADAGDARIHIDDSSTLSMARDELDRLLARSGRRELMGQLSSAGQFIRFEEMRRHGIDVRYDPVSDRVLVET
jgi:hypothetical protein